MEINYIILAHQEPQLVRRLIERLQHRNSHFYLHIDGNVDIYPFTKALSHLTNITFLLKEWRVATFWSDISCVKATLNAFQLMLANKRSGYSVLLSGQDYPLKSNAAIHAFLKQNYGKNFIDGFSLPAKEGIWGKHRGMDRLHFYNYHLYHNQKYNLAIPTIHHSSFYQPKTLLKILQLYKQKPKEIKNLRKKRLFPAYIQPYGGSQWWALPMETVQRIHDFTRGHPDYYSYHTHTHVPDEIFFQSIVHSLYPKDQIANSLTYTNWTNMSRPLPLTFLEEDFQEISNCKKKLFARKFSEKIDAKVLNMVDEKLL